MVNERIMMILSQEDISRLIISESASGHIKIIADVHGMKCYEARRFINNIIGVVHADFQLVVIHGYNHGTAIKEMLAQDFQNTHISERFPDSYNQGITHMYIAA